MSTNGYSAEAAHGIEVAYEIHSREREARRLGYWLVAGTDTDDTEAIARLIPSTPHTKAALAHQGAKAIHATCTFMGDGTYAGEQKVRLFAVTQAVDEALALARAIH